MPETPDLNDLHGAAAVDADANDEMVPESERERRGHAGGVVVTQPLRRLRHAPRTRCDARTVLLVIGVLLLSFSATLEMVAFFRELPPGTFVRAIEVVGGGALREARGNPVEHANPPALHKAFRLLARLWRQLTRNGRGRAQLRP